MFRYIVLSKYYISLFQEPDINFHLTSYISGCSQTFVEELFVGRCSLTQIVLSRVLYKFPPKLMLKCLLKNCILHIKFWTYNKVLIFFFLTKKLIHFSNNARTFFGVKHLLKNCISHNTVCPLFPLSRILSSFQWRLMLFLLFQ